MFPFIVFVGPFKIDGSGVKTEYSCSWESISELRGITCHMGSHSITCHPTQVNAPRLNPSQPGRYSICLPRRDGRLSDLGSLIAAPPGIKPTIVMPPSHLQVYVYRLHHAQSGTFLQFLSRCALFAASSRFTWLQLIIFGD